MKKCSVCKILKTLDEFYKKSSDKEVRRPECKKCSNKNNKESYCREYNTIQCRNWARLNRTRSRQIKKKHQDTSLFCKLRMALRNRLYYAVSGRMSDISAVRHLGCSVEELKAHLEKQFEPGMTWDNWTVNGWHIDHIKPLASFDLTDINELKLAVRFENLQPMWASKNQSKGSKCQN